MNLIDALIQVGQWLGWAGEHWVGLLAGAVALAFIYLMSALMLDLPLPFEKKEEKR